MSEGNEDKIVPGVDESYWKDHSVAYGKSFESTRAKWKPMERNFETRGDNKCSVCNERDIIVDADHKTAKKGLSIVYCEYCDIPHQPVKQ